jgi:uncharacterized membrane protein YgdD (TMEM256/DUF423 family)
MDRLLFVLGSVSGLIGVALGAFAAHGLKERLAPELLATFEVGVRYQMYHAFALIAAAWACARWLGMVAPVGGLAFLAGWACLAWGAWK